MNARSQIQTTITLPASLRDELRAIARLRRDSEASVLREALLDWLADPVLPQRVPLARMSLVLPLDESRELAALAVQLSTSVSALCKAAVERYLGFNVSSPTSTGSESSVKGADHVSGSSPAGQGPPP